MRSKPCSSPRPSPALRLPCLIERDEQRFAFDTSSAAVLRFLLNAPQSTISRIKICPLSDERPPDEQRLIAAQFHVGLHEHAVFPEQGQAQRITVWQWIFRVHTEEELAARHQPVLGASWHGLALLTQESELVVTENGFEILGLSAQVPRAPGPGAAMSWRGSARRRGRHPVRARTEPSIEPMRTRRSARRPRNGHGVGFVRRSRRAFLPCQAKLTPRAAYGLALADGAGAGVFFRRRQANSANNPDR